MEIRTSDKQKLKLKRSLEKKNLRKNEVVWTYLTASILADNATRAAASHALLGKNVHFSPTAEIWFEGQPLPPRKGEGNSELDLAFGNVRRRGSTQAGIEYAPATESWVAFVEAKVMSDCSAYVANDPIRNQLTRVIENALTFQSAGKFPDRVFFVLLTPRYFRDHKHRRSRLYGFKMHEYMSDPASVVRDINLCKLNERPGSAKWSYPDLRSRVDSLELNWATYEDVLGLDAELAGIDVADVARSEIPRNLQRRLTTLIGRL